MYVNVPAYLLAQIELMLMYLVKIMFRLQRADGVKFRYYYADAASARRAALR